MVWSYTISLDIAFWFNLLQHPFVIDTFMKDGANLTLMQIERERDSEQIREISIQFVADDPQYEITRTLFAFCEGIH